MQLHLMGRLDLLECQQLQHRLVYEASGRDNGQIDVLLVEHPETISVGREGSRVHIRLSEEEVRRRGLDIHWVSRGGGCVLHAPGQLAIYPIVPLSWHGWSVGQYMGRLQTALADALDACKITLTRQPERHTLWGRNGVLAAFGVSVRGGVTCHGAFLNVNPAMKHFGYVDVVPPHFAASNNKVTFGSLLAERRRPVKMSEVRAAIIEQLSRAFDCPRYHLHTGHPLYPSLSKTSCV